MASIGRKQKGKRAVSLVSAFALAVAAVVVGASSAQAETADNEQISPVSATPASKTYSWIFDSMGLTYSTQEEMIEALTGYAMKGNTLTASKKLETAFIIPGDTLNMGVGIVGSELAGPANFETVGNVDQEGWYMPGDEGLWSPMLETTVTDSDGTTKTIPLFDLTNLDSNGKVVDGSITEDKPTPKVVYPKGRKCADQEWVYDETTADGPWTYGPSQTLVEDGDTVSYGRQPTTTGAIPPHPSTLWNGWCQGALSLTMKWTPENPTPTDLYGEGYNSAAGRGYSVTFGGTQEMLDYYGTRAVTSSLNEQNADMVSVYGYASAVLPSLQLIKQVCTAYDSSGNPTCTAGKDDGWEKDSTAGDNEGDAGVSNGGVDKGVEQGRVPDGVTTIMWRMIATNTGNLPLENVRVTEDLTNIDPVQGATAPGIESTDCTDKVVKAFLEVGETASVTCQTKLDSAFEGIVQNTAGLNGTVPAHVRLNQSQDQTITDPEGNSIASRFTGYKGEENSVASNVDSAQVILPKSGIKLTKWVCAAGSDCTVPTAGSSDLTTLAGVQTNADGSAKLNTDGTVAVTQGQPTAQWVKETTVSYDATAQWMIVVTNTGNSHLTNIEVFDAAAAITGSHGASTALSSTETTPLAPGASRTYTFSTSNITDTSAFAEGDSKDADNKYAEPTYKNGDDVVNAASATATASDANGKVVPDVNGQPVKVDSNTSTAEVRADVANPAIKLTKWVCGDVAGCADPSPADLATLGGTKTVAGAAAGGWVKEAYVPQGQTAHWIMVVTNIGDTALRDVVIDKDTLTGDDSTLVSDLAPKSIDVLAIGASGSFRGTTSTITNTETPAQGIEDGNTQWANWGEPTYLTGDDVVNTASAAATPARVSETGAVTDLPKPNGEAGDWTVNSNESNAEAYTAEPAIDIEKYDTLDGDTMETGDYDLSSDPKKLVIDGKATPIRFTITNTGTEALRDITVSDVTTAGGVKVTGVSCDFSTVDSTAPKTGVTWAGPLPVEGAFDCTGTLPSMPEANGLHTDVATVVGTGVVSGVEVTDKDPWNARATIKPAVDVEKYDTLPGGGPETGDHDDDYAQLVPGTETPITFTVTNKGTEELKNIVVSDVVTEGDVALKDVSCDFSKYGGPSSGTTWEEGPLPIDASFECTAILPGLPVDSAHADEVTVTATGVVSGKPTEDEDPWKGETPTPSIDIEKYDTLKGDTPKTGDYDDSADPKALVPGVETPISFTVTNTGTEPLLDVTVSDVTTAGGVTVAGVSCDFSTVDQTAPKTGLTWAGPLPVDESFICTGTLPGMVEADGLHTDMSHVVGTGEVSGVEVTDDDPWNGIAEIKPVIDVEKYDTLPGDGPETGDHDDDYAQLKPGTETPITFMVTNRGNEDLANIVVSDAVTEGGVAVENVSCDFSEFGGPSSGTTWAEGPLPVGESFECTGTLPGLPLSTAHTDVVTVTATGVVSGKPTTDEDPWKGETPTPSIDIEKYDTLNGDTASTGDYDDSAAPKALAPGATTPISFTVTNTGTEALVDLTVSDVTTAGGVTVAGVSCDFSTVDKTAPKTGVTWAGPLPVDESFTCTGTLPGMVEADGLHTDVATVVGTGQVSGEKVTDDDPWNGEATIKPVIDVEKYDTLPGDGPAAGDHDDDYAQLKPGAETPITFTVKNEGSEELKNIVVSDVVTEGGVALTNVSCDFSKYGGPSSGTTWEEGPLPLGGTFDCTAILPGLPADSLHTDVVTVTATGVVSGKPTKDEDPWKGETPGEPGIDIEKFDTLGLDNLVTGDYDDSAEPKELAVGKDTPISFLVTNTGKESLVDVVVSDVTTAGGVTLTGVSCDFSKLGGPTSGLMWEGPVAEGESFTCTATLPGLQESDGLHTDVASVTASGEVSGEKVGDKDPWNGRARDVNPGDDDEFHPGIALTKWVCVTGTGCAAPTDADLATLAGGQSTEQWVKETTVTYNTAAEWILVVTNTGDTTLAPVAISKEDLNRGGANHGGLTGCGVGDQVVDSLAVGETVAFVGCATPAITNTAGYIVGPDVNDGAEGDVVNQAQVIGTPVDKDGAVIENPNGGGSWDQVSNTDTAEANSKPGGSPAKNQPRVDIEKFDTLGTDNETTGDYDDSSDPKLIAANTQTPIRFIVKNNGAEALKSITVSDATSAGGVALTDVSCDFSPLGGPSEGLNWVGPFEPGDAFECTGVLPALPVGELHTDVATVTGVGVVSGLLATDDDPWNGKTTDEPPTPDTPGADIEKYDTLNGDDAISGDYDNSAKPIEPGVATPIAMTVTNTGNEDLIDIVVTDQTKDGSSGVLTGLSCDFSKLGGPSSGTTWAGPFKVGDSFICTGTLPAMSLGQSHTDTATITGTGVVTKLPVGDHDDWNGKVGPKITSGGAALAGSGSIPWVGLVALALIGCGIVGFVLYRRARTHGARS
ncbi:MAG: hypothetical protein LBV00_05815 [Propionibacteriaceae bacterium]|jgi:hypothetical protein|nr:hypothetical protein [Propionibacteriaceae bacterium]